MADAASARLLVRRDREWNDMLRAYRIAVDDEEVATVRRGRDVVVEVPPGVHTVQARLDWCSSRPVTVAVGPGETAELSVRNALHGWRQLLWFVAVFFRTDEYLQLEHVRGGARPPQRPLDRG